jgi:hypothetical protein
VAAVLNTVLPPAVVDLVLSPLLIIEILFRTIVDGGTRFVAPLMLLAMSAVIVYVYDRTSKRGLFVDRI